MTSQNTKPHSVPARSIALAAVWAVLLPVIFLQFGGFGGFSGLQHPSNILFVLALMFVLFAIELGGIASRLDSRSKARHRRT